MTSTNRTVLCIDDSASGRAQLVAILRREALFDTFLEAEDGMSGFRMMATSKPDLVLCDLVMPRSDGLKFLALRGSRSELTGVPVLMLTAEADAERKAEILDRGAADYITKPFHEKELLARVRVHLRSKVLQDELREANHKLEALSVTDGLTGLFNRRHLDRQLIDEVRRMNRYRTPLSILMIDVDHFKAVNDRYGHSVGDEVLRNFGWLIRSSIRGSDVAARFGGEEFTVILPLTDQAGAVLLAERLRAAFEGLVHQTEGASLSCTASIGVASSSSAALSGEALLKLADEALYSAKRAGRNRVVGSTG